MKTSSVESLVIYGSTDCFSINDLFILLGAYSEGICHQVINETWISLGVTVCSGRCCRGNDVCGSTCKLKLVQDIFPELFKDMIGKYPTGKGELKRQDSPTFYYKNNVGVAVKMAGGCSNLAKKVSSIIAIIDIRDEYKNFGGFLLFADTDKEDAAHISKKLKDELKEEHFIYQDNMVKAYGKFIVRIFGVNDNPKENKLFGTDLDKVEKNFGVKLWEDDSHTLWSAALYPEKDTIEESVRAALNLYAIVNGDNGADLSAWKEAPKKSLCSGFNDADPDAIIAWNKRMADLVAMDEIAKAIRNKVPAGKLRKINSLTKIQKEWLERRIKKADFSEKMRLHYYLGVILNDEDEVQECFRTIQSEVLASTIKNLSYNENARIVTDKHTVKLPLRVNWGGGWSDTPPYCNENGGTVLNVAILLNGQKPVEVTLEKISEKKIVFDSRDMDVHGEFDTIEPLQATGDPFDPFALQKACLLACGIIPKEGSSLEEVLDRLGGGFEMHSEVTNVPKGSGLGTSSILSAACVKAVFEFMGIEYTEEDLYAHVLAMEQIMSTGGGWQDQVGGITPGLKYITSMPGIDQQLKVTHIEIPEAAKKELDDRFVLIYTGQRRLARNLLRDVVGRYVGNEPDSLFALEEIQKTAALMRFELERGNVDGFAKLLDYHWELSKKVDAGSSNTLIEQIFSSIEELIDGKLVCGAGGGGFLQAILKKGVTRQQVEDRLNEVFMDSLVGVADCRLVWE